MYDVCGVCMPCGGQRTIYTSWSSPSCVSRDLNSHPQAWQQASLPAEPASHQSIFISELFEE